MAPESNAPPATAAARSTGWAAAPWVGALLLVLGLGFWLLRPALPAAAPVGLAEAQAQGACVAPAQEMRRSHPDLLRHQRDLTVRDGQRGARVSLEACVGCHATARRGAGGAVPVRSVLGDPQAFCQGCHAAAAVKIDCFECHAASPGAAAVGPGATSPAGGHGGVPATPAASATLSRVVAVLRSAPVPVPSQRVDGVEASR